MLPRALLTTDQRSFRMKKGPAWNNAHAPNASAANKETNEKTANARVAAPEGPRGVEEDQQQQQQQGKKKAGSTHEDGSVAHGYRYGMNRKLRMSLQKHTIPLFPMKAWRRRKGTERPRRTNRAGRSRRKEMSALDGGKKQDRLLVLTYKDANKNKDHGN